MAPERLVAEFVAPNMTWQHDWSEELLRHQRLPSDLRLPTKVKKRLLWQLFSDLTYLSQRGRTLDRIGKATLSVPWVGSSRLRCGFCPISASISVRKGLSCQC